MSNSVESVVVKDEIAELINKGGENIEIAAELSALLIESYESIPERLPRSEFLWWKRVAEDSSDQAVLDHSVVAQSMQFNSFP